MVKVKLHNTAQIEMAIELGFVVHWEHEGYVVIQDNYTFLGFGVKCLSNDYYTPLTYSDLDSVFTYEVSV